MFLDDVVFSACGYEFQYLGHGLFGMVLPLLAAHAVVVGQLEGIQVRDFDQDVFVDVTEIVAAGRDETAIAAERDGLKVSMGEFSSGMYGTKDAYKDLRPIEYQYKFGFSETATHY